MKSMFSVALIGGAVSLAASLMPEGLGQAWGPFAVLSTGVLTLAAGIVASDHTPATRGRGASSKKAA